MSLELDKDMQIWETFHFWKGNLSMEKNTPMKCVLYPKMVDTPMILQNRDVLLKSKNAHAEQMLPI